MSLDTYAHLKSAVATKLARADLTTAIVDAITLVHMQLMRILRVREMEVLDTSFSITGETVALPTRWLETRQMYTNAGGGRVQILYMDPEKMIETNTAATSGIPRFFTVVAGNFRFSPIPDGTYTATHLYYQGLAQMSADSDHNWILDNHADLYLYGACLEVMRDIQDDPRIPMWQEGYSQAIAALLRQSARAKSGPAMQVRPG